MVCRLTRLDDSVSKAFFSASTQTKEEICKYKTSAQLISINREVSNSYDLRDISRFSLSSNIYKSQQTTKGYWWWVYDKFNKLSSYLNFSAKYIMFESSVCLNFPLGKCTVMSKCHKIMNANVYTHTTEWKKRVTLPSYQQYTSNYNPDKLRILVLYR